MRVLNKLEPRTAALTNSTLPCSQHPIAAMKPLVRDLYKRFLLAGRHYPQGLSAVRAKAKDAFRENAGLQAEADINKAIGKGRYWVRELNAISKLHKYRALNKKYPKED